MTITAAPAIYTGTVRQARIAPFEHLTYKTESAEGATSVIVPAHDDEQEHLNDVRKLISRLWASDWDSDEDSAYDRW